MSPEQEAAYIMAQAACAVIEAMGMAAANKECERKGEEPKYSEEEFFKLAEKYGIHHTRGNQNEDSRHWCILTRR